MVLSLMRKHAKSWLIKALIAIIALVFIFYFGYSFTSKGVITVASVNGDVITKREYDKTYRDLIESYRRQYKNIWNDELAKVLGLKAKALDTLISERLISQEAKSLGLEVTENEIKQEILEFPYFQLNGQFNLGRYHSMLASNRMKPEDFEADMALKILSRKLSHFILAFMQVSEREILDHYTFQNESIKISYMIVDPEKFKNSIEPDKTEIEAFFREHKENYRTPEKIKCEYIVIDPDKFRDQVEITESDIKAYYEYNMEAFTQPKKIKVRHILFELSENVSAEQEAKVKKTAEKVLAMAREGKDFAGLAKKYSQGQTRSDGGDLGYIQKGKIEDKAFENAAFALKKGEISDIVRGQRGFHIIKIEDIKEAVTKPPNEVSAEIKESLKKDLSKEKAHETTLNLIDQMPYDIKLRTYADERGFSAVETNYFSISEPIVGIAADDKLRQSLFALEDGDTSDLIELEGKYYIFQVADRQESSLPKFEDVSFLVKAGLINNLAAKKASVSAEELLKELQSGKEWATLAEENNLKPVKTDFFKRSDTIPELGRAEDLSEKAFALNKDNKYPDKIFSKEKGAILIKFEERKGIDKEKFENEKEKYRNSIVMAKQRYASQVWLENLKKNAEIEIENPPN
ncbi:SurA N-terminal domain-containing protein [Thermodesulfobacteriota bacterium]